MPSDRRALRTLFVVFSIALAFVALFATVTTVRHLRPHATPRTISNTINQNPGETNRDQADVTLDRKFKGICKGC
jgi:hypothetical protein